MTEKKHSIVKVKRNLLSISILGTWTIPSSSESSHSILQSNDLFGHRLLSVSQSMILKRFDLSSSWELGKWGNFRCHFIFPFHPSPKTGWKFRSTGARADCDDENELNDERYFTGSGIKRRINCSRWGPPYHRPFNKLTIY